MAFVFKSQKSSPFSLKQQQKENLDSSLFNNQQSMLNGQSYINSPKNSSSFNTARVVKGLPSLLGKKNYSFQSIQFQNMQKQNYFFRQKPLQKIKVNTQKLKNPKQSHFFISTIIREPYNNPFKQLSQNSCMTSKFDLKENDSIKRNQLVKTSEPIRQTTLSKLIINKNLINTTFQNIFDFKKSSIKNQLTQEELDRIVLSCSDNNNLQRKGNNLPYKKTDKKVRSQIFKLTNKQLKTEHKFFMQNHIKANTQINKQVIKQIENTNTSELQKKLGRLKKGVLQTSFYKDQSEDEDEQQLIDESTPGPGAYEHNINLKEKKSFRSKKQKFAKIFVSPLQRFKQQVKYNEITPLNQEGSEIAKKQNKMFLSKTPKFLSIQKRSYSPPPGAYNVRQSIQHTVVSNLLKSSNVPNFCSSLPRFKNNLNNTTPGPGDYNIDSYHQIQKQQSNQQNSYYYKSQVKRCMNPCQEDRIKQNITQNAEIQLLVDKEQDKQSVIHKKQKHFDSSQFFTAPPFCSGVQRFAHFSQIFNQQQQPLKQNLQHMKKEQKKNIQPFNSTLKRHLSQNLGHVVGVGSYIVGKDNWNKKSYNVLFH